MFKGNPFEKISWKNGTFLDLKFVRTFLTDTKKKIFMTDSLFFFKL